MARSRSAGGADLRDLFIRYPFCRLEVAALLLDLNFNQIEHEWETDARGLRARCRNGDDWKPAGHRLMLTTKLYPLLDERGRELFERFQRDELPCLDLVRQRRDAPVRGLLAEVEPNAS